MFRDARWVNVCAENVEKAGLAAAVVLAVVLLGGTRWRPVEHEPGKLRAAVTDVRERVQSSDWPDDERGRFRPADYRRRVERLLTGLSADGFDYGVPMFWPLHPPRPPVREPVWHPVAEMQADFARLAVEGKPQPIPGEQRAAEQKLGEIPRGVPQPRPALRRALPFRCVSVRGIVESKRQLQEVLAARRGRPVPAGRPLLEYRDFEIERQQASGSEGPWDAQPWTPLDIKVVEEVLRQASAILAEEEYAAVSSDALTMPLPQLLLGSWDELAGHPRIESLREQSADGMRNARAAGKGAEQELPGNGGFKGIRQVGPRRGLQNQLRQGENERKAPLPSDELLLFRFVDFTVKPGHAYRYRVRLKLPNPNFGLSHVTDPSVAEGIERWTPWSSPTNPVYVVKDAQFYLVDVEQPRLSQQPQSLVELFEWDDELGAVNRATVELTTGQPISGPFETERFDPSVPEFFNELYPFETGYVFVDGLASPRLSPQQHAALDVFQGDSRRSQRIGVPAVMLVADRNGTLSVRDSLSAQPLRVAAGEFVEHQRAPFRKQVERRPDVEAFDGVEGLYPH